MSRLCKKFSAGASIDHRGNIEDTLCGKLRFSKNKMGTQYNISRPSFKAGSIMTGNYVPSLRPNERRGLGNYDMSRNNFLSPNIKGRKVIDFERLEALDVEQAGIKVQLGDKTIEKMFKIQIDDPSDVAWIQEKQRRLRAGETEEEISQRLPLGRPQRKIPVMRNFGAQSLSVDDKIEMLKNSIIQGTSTSRDDMRRLREATIKLLSNFDTFTNITRVGINDLERLIRNMSVPKNWKTAGLEHRYWTLPQYRQMAGFLNLFLLSNISDVTGGRTFEEPVFSFNEQGTIVGKMSILNLVKALSPTGKGKKRKPGRILDVEQRAVIPFNVAVAGANSGIDGGQLNGQYPDPAVGMWLPDVLPVWDLPAPPTKSDKTQEEPQEEIKFQG